MRSEAGEESGLRARAAHIPGTWLTRRGCTQRHLEGRGETPIGDAAAGWPPSALRLRGAMRHHLARRVTSGTPTEKLRTLQAVGGHQRRARSEPDWSCASIGSRPIGATAGTAAGLCWAGLLFRNPCRSPAGPFWHPLFRVGGPREPVFENPTARFLKPYSKVLKRRHFFRGIDDAGDRYRPVLSLLVRLFRKFIFLKRFRFKFYKPPCRSPSGKDLRGRLALRERTSKDTEVNK